MRLEHSSIMLSDPLTENVLDSNFLKIHFSVNLHTARTDY